MERRWIYNDIPTTEEISELGKKLNVNPYLTAVLLQRGINDYETAKNFFRPCAEHLHDPYLMQDMEKAVQRMAQAIERQEKILIYGD